MVIFCHLSRLITWGITLSLLQGLIQPIISQGSVRLFNVTENILPGSVIANLGSSPPNPVENYAIHTLPFNMALDGVSGALTLIPLNTLSYHVTSSYNFTLQVYKVENGEPLRVESILIVVEDVNNQRPVLSRTFGSYVPPLPDIDKAVLYLGANTGPGVVVYRMKATDIDSNSQLVYSFTPGREVDAQGKFMVVPQLGYVVTTPTASFVGAPATYTLSLRVTDANSISNDVSYADMTLVISTGALPPLTPDQTAVFLDLPENKAAGYVFANKIPFAPLNYVFDPLSYAFHPSSPNTGLFGLNTDTGALSSYNSYDYEQTPPNQQAWVLVFTATENGTVGGFPQTSNYGIFVVRVTDDEDNVPFFQQSYYTVESVKENTALNAVVLSVSATDIDSDLKNRMMHYALSDGNSTHFGVRTNPTNQKADIYVARPLDYDKNKKRRPFYEMTLRVSNTAMGALSTTAPSTKVRIYLQNVNDNPPEFVLPSYNIDIRSDSPSGTAVVAVQAFDMDGSKITYKFLGPDNITLVSSMSAFEIDQNTGAIKTTAKLNERSYNLTVVATDDGTCISGCIPTEQFLQNSVSIQITTSEINANKPIFKNSETEILSMSESSVAGANITKITATDEDPGLSGKITYSLVANSIIKNPEFYLSIDSTTGVISVAKPLTRLTIFNLHEIDRLYITIKAEDSGTPPLNSLLTLRLILEDINDNPPVFYPNSYMIVLVQDTSYSGQVVGTLQSSDVDDLPNNADGIFTKIGSPSHGSWSVDPTSGRITVTGTFGQIFTTQTTTGDPVKPLQLTVQVKNTNPLVLPAGESGPTKPWNTIVINIYVTNDANLYPPVAQSSSITVNENIATNSKITTIAATAPSGSSNYELTASVLIGNTIATNQKNHFRLNGWDLILSSELDITICPTYKIGIKVAKTDGESIGNIFTIIYITINLIDVNNKIPLFPNAESEKVITMPENPSATFVITNLFALDFDKEINFKTIQYTLGTEADADNFVISNKEIKPKPGIVFDAESSKTKYTFSVIAQDGAPSSLPSTAPNPNKATFHLTIIITDVNDVKPTLIDCATYDVAENVSVRYPVTTIKATDKDSQNLRFQFVTSAGTETPFHVNPLTGAIYTSYRLFSSSNPKSYNTLLRVTDGALNDDCNVILKVLAAPFNPTFTNRSPSYTIQEGAINILGSVTATVTPTAPLTYSISGHWKSYFQIDPNTGELRVIKGLNANPPAGLSSYYLTVMAAVTGDPSRFDVVPVEVKVTNLNNSPPVFLAESLNVKLRESQTTVQLQAFDADGGTIEFALSGTNPKCTVSTTGSLTVPTAYDYEALGPNFEDRNFLVPVVVSNPGSALSTTATLVVSIVDDNDQPPVFNPTQVSVTIPENSPVDTHVTSVKANDPDPSSHTKLTYTIVSATPSTATNYFTVDNLRDVDSGAVRLINPLDYENSQIPKSSVLRIKASDGLNQAPTVTLTINVANIIEPPDVTITPPVPTLAEGTAPGQKVADITLVSRDGDQTDYDFQLDPNTDFDNIFKVTKNTPLKASLDVNKLPNFETLFPGVPGPVSLPVNVLVTPKTGTADPNAPYTITVPVKFTNVNNKPPVLGGPRIATVSSDQPAGTLVMPQQFPVIDPDLGGPSDVTFTPLNAGDPVWTNFGLLPISPTQGTSMSIRTLKPLTAGTSNVLPIVVTDSGGFKGTSTVTVNVAPVTGDTSYYVKTMDVFISETWQWFYLNSSAKMEIDYVDIFNFVPAVRAQKSFELTTTTPYFTVDSGTGMVYIQGNTLPGNYTIQVTCTQPSQASLYFEAKITVTFISYQALQRMSSVRVFGLAPEDFVIRPTDSTPRIDSVNPSIADKMKYLLANLIPADPVNVDIFAMSRVPNIFAIDVFFAVHGSPYYNPAMISSLLNSNRAQLDSILTSYGSNVSWTISPVDVCGTEGQTRLLCPSSGSCTSQTSVLPTPQIGKMGTNAAVSLGVEMRPQCTSCGIAQPGPPTGTCNSEACFNRGTCYQEPNTFTKTCGCTDPFYQTGPRCQVPMLGFQAPGGYACISGFPEACANLHLSFSFLTSQSGAASQLLLYVGPSNHQRSVVTSDYLLVALVGGKLMVTLELGSGAIAKTLSGSANLQDNTWHTVNLHLQTSVLLVELDYCQKAPIAAAGVVPDYSSCRMSLSAGPSKVLNVNGAPLQVGGVPSSSAGVYPATVNQGPLIGAIKDLRINAQLIDLTIVPGTSLCQLNVIQPVGDFNASCQLPNGNPLCGLYGVCVAVYGGAQGSGQCICKPGYRNDATSQTKCTLATKVFNLKPQSFVKWRFPTTTLTPQQNLAMSLMFRTRRPEGTLIIIDGFWSTYYKEMTMEVRISNSRLQFIPNMGGYTAEVYTLPNTNVADGAWHHIHVYRSLSTVEMKLDGGEGVNFLYSPGSTSNTYNYFLISPSASVGASLTPDPNLPTNSINPTFSDLYDTCIQDVRINDNQWMPLDAADANLPNSVSASIEISRNVDGSCPALAACPAGFVCPAGLVCIPTWNPASPYCGCTAGSVLVNGACLPLNPCLPDPCINIGRCEYHGNAFRCMCIEGMYNKNCTPIASALAGGWIALIVILLVLLLILLILLIWCCCCRDKREHLLPPDEDTRENVINYYTSAGEVDTDDYDIDLLKRALYKVTTDAPIIPMTKPTVNKPLHAINPTDINNRIIHAEADNNAPPQDYTLDYGYEGQGSDAGDLTSIASGTTDASQNFDPIGTWGQPFNSLADLYNPRS